MTVTVEKLDKTIAVLTGQRDQHYTLYQQAVGALAVCAHLKAEAEKDDTEAVEP